MLMSLPTLAYLEQLGEPLRGILKGFEARLGRFLGVEHADDGSHLFPFVPVTFSATDFSGATGMTWTVAASNVDTFVYRKIGTSLLVSGIWNNTSVTAPLSPVLTVKIPGGYTANRRMQTGARALDNGVGVAAFCQVQQNGTTIEILRADGANWAASVSNSSIRVHLEFEIKV